MVLGAATAVTQGKLQAAQFAFKVFENFGQLMGLVGETVDHSVAVQSIR